MCVFGHGRGRSMIDHVRIWMRAIAKRVLDLRAGLTRAPKRRRKSRKMRSAKPNVPRASLFGERRLAVTMIWSLVAALAVYAASYELQKISGFSPAADEGGDDLLSLQADQSAYPGTTIPIVAIDFNDEAFTGLGWPPFVPRHQLSRVMKIA